VVLKGLIYLCGAAEAELTAAILRQLKDNVHDLGLDIWQTYQVFKGHVLPAGLEN